MKTVKFYFFVLFLSCFSVSQAQITVNSEGNATFGKYSNLGLGISIIDEYTRTGASPFKLVRTAKNKIQISRSTANSGILMGTNGNIRIGCELDQKVRFNDIDLPDTAPLILTSDKDYILDAYQQNAGGNGIRVNYHSATSMPFSTYFGGGTSGIRTFYVNGFGEAFAHAVFLTSDVSTKSNIENISAALDKIMQLRGVTYDMKILPEETSAKKSINSEEDDFLIAKKRTPTLTRDVFRQMGTEKKRKRMGIIAQEVEKVIPEVIRTREDGLKSVAYTELIGLLIEGMKEQQQYIDELNLKVAALEGKNLRASTQTTSLKSIDNLTAQCILSQNTPNPFTQQTEIKYYLAEGIKEAFICVFDMQGKMLLKLNVIQGNNSVTIEGSKLSAGMYLYSLIADGQEIDTKRMILTR